MLEIYTLVTGGSGVIGSWVLEKIIQENRKIKCLIRNQIQLQNIKNKVKEFNLKARGIMFCRLVNTFGILKAIIVIFLIINILSYN